MPHGLSLILACFSLRNNVLYLLAILDVPCGRKSTARGRFDACHSPHYTKETHVDSLARSFFFRYPKYHDDPQPYNSLRARLFGPEFFVVTIGRAPSRSTHVAFFLHCKYTTPLSFLFSINRPPRDVHSNSPVKNKNFHEILTIFSFFVSFC